MKKSTVAAILYALNGILVFAIVILIVLIVKRGPKPEEPVVATVSEDEYVEDEYVPVEEPQDTSVTVLVAVPDTTSSVNVRSGPSTDYQRIGSAYADYDYEVITILDCGWTMGHYEDLTGYISSDLLIYKTKTTYTASDAATFMDATEEEIEAYMEGNQTDDGLTTLPTETVDTQEETTEEPADAGTTGETTTEE